MRILIPSFGAIIDLSKMTTSIPDKLLSDKLTHDHDQTSFREQVDLTSILDPSFSDQFSRPEPATQASSEFVGPGAAYVRGAAGELPPSVAR